MRKLDNGFILTRPTQVRKSRILSTFRTLTPDLSECVCNDLLEHVVETSTHSDFRTTRSSLCLPDVPQSLSDKDKARAVARNETRA